MYFLCEIDMYSLKFVEACSCCLNHRFLRGLRLQALHSSDIVGLFSIVERSPEIAYFSKGSNLKKIENVFAIHVAGVKFGSHFLKVHERTRREKTSRGY